MRNLPSLITGEAKVEEGTASSNSIRHITYIISRCFGQKRRTGARPDTQEEEEVEDGAICRMTRSRRHCVATAVPNQVRPARPRPASL